MSSESDLESLARGVLDRCRGRGLTLATVESCTGGTIAAALTAIAGSSDVVERGYVTYSNAAKAELVGVDPGLIVHKGAVSGEVAAAMAEGALARAPVDLAISVTGIAGPGGATPEKPVGLVFIGLARRGEPARTERHVFAGDRAAVRAQSVVRALQWLAEAADMAVVS